MKGKKMIVKYYKTNGTESSVLLWKKEKECLTFFAKEQKKPLKRYIESIYDIWGKSGSNDSFSRFLIEDTFSKLLERTK